MSGQAGAARCPHCGAENPRSPLITMCQQCKGSLTGPSAAPSLTVALGPRPPSPPHSPRSPEPSPAVRQPLGPAEPAPLGERTQPTRAVAEEHDHYGHRAGHLRESPLVGFAILFFALATFGAAFALVLWLSR